MKHWLGRLAIIAGAVALFALAREPAEGGASTYTVVTTADHPDTSPGDGRCRFFVNLLNPLPDINLPCSLRAAIMEANANPGVDTIAFNIGAGGAQTFAPASPYQDITEPVVINGTTQPGFAGSPLIELNGAGAGAGADGLRITSGGTLVRGLVINRFADYGIEITGGGGNIVQGNFIGTNAAGSAAGPGNGGVAGIFIQDSSNNQIGGDSASARNVISGNSQDGIRIASYSFPNPNAPTQNRVEGNYVGTDASGSNPVGNGSSGIVVNGAHGNFIGGVAGTSPGGSCTGQCNLISGNTREGVEVVSTGGDDNQLLGNFIGVNAAGLASIANGGAGVKLRFVQRTLIGNGLPSGRNLISGNTSGGVGIDEGGESSIKGNFIGTDTTGSDALANGTAGVLLTDSAVGAGGGSTSISIGGAQPGEGNVISGNAGNGIELQTEDARFNSIFGNLIGTNAAGTGPLPNSGSAVSLLDAPRNMIGGTAPGMGNTISGNGGNGVQISGPDAASNTVQGNYIGTGADGTEPLGNAFFGVRLVNGAHDNVIGGAAAGAGNLIAANTVGVRISDAATTMNRVHGNLIGTNSDGAAGLGNLNEGVYVSNSPGNTIGGGDPGEGNVVRNNGAAGVRIQDSDAIMNRISGNSIDDNATLGIQLDNGANGGQAAPVLTSAENGSTHVIGSLDSAPSTQYRVELFDSPACDGSGTGEGRTYLGFGSATTGIGGAANIDITIPATATAGHVVTATATDPGGNTSEFSNCVIVTGSATPTPTASATTTPTPTSTGATPTPTPTASPSVTPTPTFAAGLRGDGDCDGDVDLDDVIAALSEFAGVDPGAPCADRADVDCDGDVDGEDALRILLHVAGTPKQPPSGCGPIGVPA